MLHVLISLIGDHLLYVGGVGAIPPSAFFSKENAHIAENYVRFAFCKRDNVIEAASGRLQRLRDLCPTH